LITDFDFIWLQIGFHVLSQWRLYKMADRRKI